MWETPYIVLEIVENIEKIVSRDRKSTLGNVKYDQNDETIPLNSMCGRPC